MIASLSLFLRRLRSRFSRTAWAIRNFNLPFHLPLGKKPGLIMIQIDGLSQTEFERALANGNVPFLKSLIEDQEYENHALFPGLPASTPAAQGELMYGVKQIVPAFCYYDKACGRIFSCFEGTDAREIQSRLEKRGDPLLKEGSAYSEIYTGGAAEAHFCMTQLGWPAIIRNAPPLKLAVLTLLHVPSLVRIGVLAVIELLLAVIDFFRGLIEKQDFWRELKFVPSRIAVSIIMREIIVVRSAMDLMRGLPVVHLNFLGFDEQSHRRGPDSRFAHWTLKGIDRAIKRVYCAGGRSMRRDYDVWIYSDHGQVKTVPYEKRHGETVSQAVSRVFDQEMASARIPLSGIQFQRARMLKVKRHRPETQPPEKPPIVTALGPLGCIYLETDTDDQFRAKMARDLVRDAGIPMVFCADGPERAAVWTKRGRFALPSQAVEVLGPDHHYPHETAAEMVDLVHHEHAGDFFISGFSPDTEPVAFANENGSHGGVSPNETRAFALLPNDAPLPPDSSEPLRLSDIRTATRQFLRVQSTPLPTTAAAPASPRKSLRILTYNVHNCAGMDGYISPRRIARVIEREDPDIVALQEVDVGQRRSERQDQAKLIARYLDMYHHFHPAIAIGEEEYGDAILSTLPLEVMRSGMLPRRYSWLVDEPRGALWVSIDIGGGQKVQVLNTHFGMWKRERGLQAEALLGEEWLQSPACQGPVLLCGDFNSPPNSAVCKRFKTHLRDIQEHLADHEPRATFASPFPLHRIDHIFISEHWKVKSIRIPRTHLARVSSDHLPLVVDLDLTGIV